VGFHPKDGRIVSARELSNGNLINFLTEKWHSSVRWDTRQRFDEFSGRWIRLLRQNLILTWFQNKDRVLSKINAYLDPQQLRANSERYGASVYSREAVTSQIRNWNWCNLPSHRSPEEPDSQERWGESVKTIFPEQAQNWACLIPSLIGVESSDDQSSISQNSSVEHEIGWWVTFSACDFKIILQILQLAVFLIHMWYIMDLTSGEKKSPKGWKVWSEETAQAWRNISEGTWQNHGRMMKA
jgi:hypothetical protein